MPRSPIGERAMSNAERQRLWRDRRRGLAAKVGRPMPPTKGPRLFTDTFPTPPPARPEGGFAVVYADPPWSFRPRSVAGRKRGDAESHYATLLLAHLRALPVRDWAARDRAVLFLWAPWNQTPAVAELMRAWGFAFSTLAFNWVKLRRGADPGHFTGDDLLIDRAYHTRGCSEACWLGVRGVGHKNARRDKGVRQVVLTDVTEDVPEDGPGAWPWPGWPETVVAPHDRRHSRKPEEVARRIAELYPGPYLELFARRTRPGWTLWGNQVGLLDSAPAPA